jgi:hypothetical protein
MSTPAKTSWRMTGECLGSCMCAWGCPCQFNALPTHGRCDALGGWEVREGHFGTTRLDGVRFAWLLSFPGPVHEANGTRQVVIDAHASQEQRAALLALFSGTQGGAFFEIFHAVCPHELETIIAPITLQIDRERRQGLLRIPGIGESRAEPIKNPITGDEHRARIVLPDGFEYKEAEMANAVALRVHSVPPLVFEYANTYAQLNAFDWSNA